jgi:hypothetical protein
MFAIAGLWPSAAYSQVAGEDAMPEKKSDAKEPGPQKGLTQQTRIRISKETTRYTEPLTPNGYLNYVEALNRKFAGRVPADQNGAVIFVQLLDPENTWQFFESLGIDPQNLG